MMRAVVLALVLANAGYFAWSQGHLLSLAGAGSWADPNPRLFRAKKAQCAPYT